MLQGGPGASQPRCGTRWTEGECALCASAVYAQISVHRCTFHSSRAQSRLHWAAPCLCVCYCSSGEPRDVVRARRRALGGRAAAAEPVWVREAPKLPDVAADFGRGQKRRKIEIILWLGMTFEMGGKMKERGRAALEVARRATLSLVAAQRRSSDF